MDCRAAWLQRKKCAGTLIGDWTMPLSNQARTCKLHVYLRIFCTGMRKEHNASLLWLPEALYAAPRALCSHGRLGWAPSQEGRGGGHGHVHNRLERTVLQRG